MIDLAEARRLRAVKTAAGWLYDPESVEAFAERESKKNKEGEKVWHQRLALQNLRLALIGLGER